MLTKQPAQFIEDGQVSLRLRTLITLSCPAVTAVYSAKNMTVLCAAWGCFSCAKEFFADLSFSKFPKALQCVFPRFHISFLWAEDTCDPC